MQESKRRVNRLRLTAQDESSLRADVDALQDAFRIASLPGLPPHGLLLIKKLDLGAFRTRASALELAQLIDTRIRTLGADTVCADRGDRVDEDLVWFSDIAAAATLLAEQVANNRNPRAWYWQTLFPGWRQDLDLAHTLAAIVSSQHSLAPAPALVTRILEYLIPRIPVDQVARAVSTQLAQTLLREAGVYRGPTDLPAPTPSMRPPPRAQLPLPGWTSVIRRALGAFGGRDPRCLWLGYAALTSSNPALAENPELFDRIESILTELEFSTEPPRAEAPARNAQETREMQPAASSGPVAATEFDGNGHSDRTPGIPRDSAPDSDRDPHRSSARQEARRRSDIADDRAAAVGGNYDPPSSGANTGESSAEAAAANTVAADAPVEDFDSTTLNDDAPAIFEGLLDCDQAGLGFLLPLLQLMSIDRLLADNPTLAEINFPARLIKTIAARLKVPANHPLLLALPETQAGGARLESLVCPARWRELVVAPGAGVLCLHRFDTSADGSRCYLTDSSGRLLLYAGAGKLPRWTHEYQVRHHAGTFPGPDSNDLGRGLQLLMTRYLRRYAGISMRQLVHRPGRIASTRTHLDILFDSGNADIRIRKAGLDIDPGWVAWLARVVQFHYEDGDMIDV